jgi:hypothetical protein
MKNKNKKLSNLKEKIMAILSFEGVVAQDLPRKKKKAHKKRMAKTISEFSKVWSKTNSLSIKQLESI